MNEVVLIVAAILLLAGVLASRVSDRFGVPALLLFLLLGMLAGSDGPGGIYFDDPAIAQYIGVIALILILFSGGLDTQWSQVRPVLKEGLLLSTFGVLITAVVVGLITVYLLGFSLLEGLLFGAIVSSTDAAAVFAVLRSRGIQPEKSSEAAAGVRVGQQRPDGDLPDHRPDRADHRSPTCRRSACSRLFVLQMAVGRGAGLWHGQSVTLADQPPEPRLTKGSTRC